MRRLTRQKLLGKKFGKCRVLPYKFGIHLELLVKRMDIRLVFGSMGIPRLGLECEIWESIYAGWRKAATRLKEWNTLA
jgi:hypothetical protein